MPDASRADLDRTERRILAAVQENGRMANTDLADAVGLSESSCLRRLRNLERRGVVEGYAAVVDRRSLGLAVAAFVQVTLDKQADACAGAFTAHVLREPHIVECHAVSGAHDYLLKVVARDIDHFSELVMRRILKYPGVTHVESSFSLDEVKTARALPT